MRMTAMGLVAAALVMGCREGGEPAGAPSSTPTSSSVVVPPSATPRPSTSASSSPRPAKPIRVAFVGDLCMSLQVGIQIDKLAEGIAVPETVTAGYPFSHVAERLKKADFLVGNLECVLSMRGQRSTDHNPFRCSMRSPKLILDAGFDLVSVANNHAMDYGRPGFLDMLKNLDAAGLPHFGKETFSRAAQSPVIREVGGVKIGLLAYYWPPKVPLVDVEKARPQVDVLFVFMHWGMDDTAEPMELQRRLARDFIDAGVDVVVGTHAHVLQPTDWYKGKFIAYGLGNFAFSGMMHTPAHRIGAMLEVDITPSTRALRHRLIRMQLEHDGAPRWLDAPVSVQPEVAP